MIPKIFVSATNTNVGKTYVMKELIKGLSQKGYKVGVFKPIETGVEEQPADAAMLWDCAKQYNKGLENLELRDVCPYQFRLPAAPYVAKGDSVISIDHLKVCLEKLEAVSDIVLIEGAGGLMVPIFEEYLMIDLVQELADKLLLVVPSRLGSINDTLLNLHMLKEQAIPFEWAVNLYEDKEDFERITRPYYQEKYPDHMIVQRDLERIVARLLKF